MSGTTYRPYSSRPHSPVATDFFGRRIRYPLETTCRPILVRRYTLLVSINEDIDTTCRLYRYIYKHNMLSP